MYVSSAGTSAFACLLSKPQADRLSGYWSAVKKLTPGCSLQLLLSNQISKMHGTALNPLTTKIAQL
jgi:hypothetical protein